MPSLPLDSFSALMILFEAGRYYHSYDSLLLYINIIFHRWKLSAFWRAIIFFITRRTPWYISHGIFYADIESPEAYMLLRHVGDEKHWLGRVPLYLFPLWAATPSRSSNRADARGAALGRTVSAEWVAACTVSVKLRSRCAFARCRYAIYDSDTIIICLPTREFPRFRESTKLIYRRQLLRTN